MRSRNTTLLFCAIVLTNSSIKAEERELFKFDSPNALKPWTSVNDGVMGGRSIGSFRLNQEQHLEFYGNLSLANNGGFASIRARGSQFELSANDSIVLTIRGDGRRYNLNLYTQADLRGYSYRQSFYSVKGELIKVSLPVGKFVATWRGRVFPNEKLVPENVTGLGILLGDKRSGPFKLEVESIKVVR